jgi:hypothetical protein
MPRIAAFYGIFVYMYFDDTRQHAAPHVHARYGGFRASYSIETGEPLAGQLLPKQHRRMREWIAQHRDGLEENWRLALRGERLRTLSSE